MLRGLPSDPKARKLVINLAIAFMPAAILGLAFNRMIKDKLFAPLPVAIALIVGGFIILWVERRNKNRASVARIETVDDMNALDALKIGFAQAFALIPGTSRSGATIIGGMLFGLSRKQRPSFPFSWRFRRCLPPPSIRCTRIARCCRLPIFHCSRSVSWRRLFRHSCVCAGCCATSAAMISPRSPGIGSCSAWWWWSPAIWAG
ncbi:bacitracin resistance BacA family protein [Collimonas arenae]|uniref:Undecaprenyl-diphosphatase n=1 Tax=Collimonas arenae TaxID=279058 RepID=A0A127QEZ1_9BURK|nr:bacitracin resistance BacA family protein [Collimonas arenae]